MSDDPFIHPRKPAVATFVAAGAAYAFAYGVAPALPHPTCEDVLTACVGDVPLHHRHHPETAEGVTVVVGSTSGSGALTAQPRVDGAGFISQLGLMGVAGPVHGTLPRRG